MAVGCYIIKFSVTIYPIIDNCIIFNHAFSKTKIK